MWIGGDLDRDAQSTLYACGHLSKRADRWLPGGLGYLTHGVAAQQPSGGCLIEPCAIVRRMRAGRRAKQANRKKSEGQSWQLAFQAS